MYKHLQQTLITGPELTSNFVLLSQKDNGKELFCLSADFGLFLSYTIANLFLDYFSLLGKVTELSFSLHLYHLFHFFLSSDSVATNDTSVWYSLAKKLVFC